MVDGAASLYAAVVASPDNLALVHQHGPDRNAAFGQTFARLFYRGA
jgi:hypothetical protein